MYEDRIAMGDTGEAARRQRKKGLCLELSVFLFLIVPSMVLSFFVALPGKAGFLLLAIQTILRDLALMVLVLYFVRRNGESVGAVGWTTAHLLKEICIGLALFIPVSLAMAMLGDFLQKAGLSAPSSPLPALLGEKNAAQITLASFLVIIVALTEETIFRGYLILRFTAVTSSPCAAVILSAAIFSLGHGYEGTAGAVTVGFMGIVLALLYLWRKSLAAPVVIHFLQDFTGMVLIPLLRQLRVIE